MDIIFLLRVLCAMSSVTRPCPDTACLVHRQRAAVAVVVVASDEPDPDEAAALLLGTGGHETGFREEHQRCGGPAVTYWQLEVPRHQRAALLADPVVAARAALTIARRGMRAYAGREGETAEELRRYVWRARRALATGRAAHAARELDVHVRRALAGRE